MAIRKKIIEKASRVRSRIRNSKHKQLKPINIILSIILGVAAVLAIRKGYYKSGVAILLAFAVHNIYPTAITEATLGISAVATVLSSVTFYTVRALLYVVGYKVTRK